MGKKKGKKGGGGQGEAIAGVFLGDGKRRDAGRDLETK